MSELAPSPRDVHAEMDHARDIFHELVARASVEDLARGSNGTRWTNRQLLFHMLFGYLITRNLLVVIKIISRLPQPIQRGFALVLDAAARPFHQINYWGSRAGARIVTPRRMVGWFDRVIASLHRHLDAESEDALRRSMPFPTRWDPFFVDRMTLPGVYHTRACTSTSIEVSSPSAPSKRVDERSSSIYFDDMSEAVSQGSRMVEAAGDPDPATGLAAVAALRSLVEVLEELQVDNARGHGWSWRDIARVLGVSKQAMHYKHADRLRGRR